MTPSEKPNGKRTTIVATALGSLLAGTIVWAATLVGRVRDIDHLESRVHESSTAIRALPDKYVPRAELITALRSIEHRLERIETKLDRLAVRSTSHGHSEQ